MHLIFISVDYIGLSHDYEPVCFSFYISLVFHSHTIGTLFDIWRWLSYLKVHWLSFIDLARCHATYRLPTSCNFANLDGANICLPIWTNTFCNSNKYIMKFRQIHFSMETYTFCNSDKYILARLPSSCSFANPYS